MKVLLFEPYVFQLYGNGRYIVNLARMLHRECVDLLLVAPCEGILTRAVNKMIRVEIIAAPSRLLRHGGTLLHRGIIERLKTILELAAYWRKLRVFFRREKGEVLQVHNIRALLTAGPPAKLAGLRILWYVKGELNNRFLDTLGFLLADKVLFQSERNRDRRYPLVCKLFKNKIEVLLNGIDLSAIRAIPATRSDAEDDHIKVGYFGVICPDKGVDDLVRAFSLVSAKFSNVQLFLVGDNCIPEYGTFYQNLRRDIAAQNLDHRIHFLGYQEDPLPVIQGMDIVVLPSKAEGMPKSIMEAMAFGKPVIATSVGGVRDLVEDEHEGLVIPPNDVVKLNQALERLIIDSELRKKMGAAGRRKAFLCFDFQTHARELERVYGNIGVA